jgi:hypothetical protein
MGTYLATGIVQDIVIDKRDIRFKDITAVIIQKHLTKELDINYYNFSEDSDQYCWKIKPEIFESELVEFLRSQFAMYKDIQDESMKKTLAQLAIVKTGSEILSLASSRNLVNFQLLEPITHYIRVVRDNGFDEAIDVSYKLISYFLNGKIIMECYNSIFNYFERNIRLQAEKYPLVNCIKVMITD